MSVVVVVKALSRLPRRNIWLGSNVESASNITSTFCVLAVTWSSAFNITRCGERIVAVQG